MSQTMRALVKRKAAEGIWMEEVPVPSPGTNEVLIKLEKTAICGTDLHIYLWDDWAQRMYETWYKMTQMVLTGFPLRRELTHHIPIENYEHGFELMRTGECGKVVCDWTGEI